jgi:hypothetical protein
MFAPLTTRMRTTGGSHIVRPLVRGLEPRPTLDGSVARSSASRNFVAGPSTESRAVLAELQTTRGNQAVLRTLSGAGSMDSTGVRNPAVPYPFGAAAPGALDVPMVQRQDAGGIDTGGMDTGAMGNGGPAAGNAGAASPAAGGAPVASGANAWSTNDIFAILSSKNGSCLGSANASGTNAFSTRCGPVKGPFCQAAGITFVVDFVVDFPPNPRPAGFTPPTVSVHFEFRTSGGATTLTIDKNDPNPRYVASGSPLEPSFGHEFPVSTSDSGNLFVDLHIFDPDTNTSVDYLDNIKFIVTPCI